MKTPDFRPAIRRALNRPCTVTLERIAPSLRRRAGTYDQAQRLARIKEYFANGGELNCTDLANIFHVSLATINRDLAHLRKHGLEISYDPRAYTFALKKAA